MILLVDCFIYQVWHSIEWPYNFEHADIDSFFLML